MTIDGDKIKALIEVYGQRKGYPEKSYIPKFCEDFDLNYIQWFSYVKGKTNPGLKIIYNLVNIFPELNLNWLLKEDSNMFTDPNVVFAFEEPSEEYRKEVSNNDIMKKLDIIEKEIKKLKSSSH
jgi:hypothetical protein